jgi:hypothetical protein
MARTLSFFLCIILESNLDRRAAFLDFGIVFSTYDLLYQIEKYNERNEEEISERCGDQRGARARQMKKRVLR